MTGAMYKMQRARRGMVRTDVMQEELTIYSKPRKPLDVPALRAALASVKPHKPIELADLTAALDSVGQRAEQRADLKKLTDKLPWDTDTAMLHMMRHETQGPLIRQHLTDELGSLGLNRQIGHHLLTLAFSPRYLGSHIWSGSRQRKVP
jgi:hypothetical protein